MLTVEVEVNLHRVARLVIIRRKPLTSMRVGMGRGDYEALLELPGMDPRRTKVLDFDRSRGPLALVAACLDAFGLTDTILP